MTTDTIKAKTMSKTMSKNMSKTMSKKGSKKGSKKKKTWKQQPGRSTPFIRSLQNAHHFFLHRVMIVFRDHSYRLVAWHPRNGMVVNKLYPTEKGAKIGFAQLFRGCYYGDKQNIHPCWTGTYAPTEKRLTQMIKKAEKQR